MLCTLLLTLVHIGVIPGFHFTKFQILILFPQKYQNRLVVVKPAEMIHWRQLTLEYMTEESDDPEMTM